MGYSPDESMVRVDIWKDSGKWYDSIQLKWDRYSTKIDDDVELIHETFRRCLKEQYPNCYIGMRATCLEPYHVNSFPLMISVITK